MFNHTVENSLDFISERITKVKPNKNKVFSQLNIPFAALPFKHQLFSWFVLFPYDRSVPSFEYAFTFCFLHREMMYPYTDLD